MWDGYIPADGQDEFGNSDQESNIPCTYRNRATTLPFDADKAVHAS